MRKHRIYEKVDSLQIVVDCPVLTPRDLMSMLAADVEPQIKAKKALYGQGSEAFPIPRTMSIDRFSRMATRPVPVHEPTAPPAPPVVETN